MNFNLAQGFHESSLRHADRVALSIGEQEFTYLQLRDVVQPIARWLRENSNEAAPRVGILASRSLATFTGILGTCWAGGTFVPISTKLPEERLIQLLQRIRAHALVVDSSGLVALTQRVLDYCPPLILAPEVAETAERKTELNAVTAIAGKDQLFPVAAQDKPVDVTSKHVAYIIFTSGTTGIPKGVMVPTSAVAHFVAVMQSRFGLESGDRVAGMTEITFDISVFDMFVAWRSGASLLVVPASQLMAPAGFVRRQRCSVIFTVPSVVSGMQKMKMLGPGSMPTLRYSFFAGEPLPVASALQWMGAAPNSVIEDLFGPTEATVVCIGQRFSGPENATPNRGVVAIGTPFPGMEAAIVDSAMQFLGDGERGELLLAGTQLSSGYFDAEDLSRASFPVLAGKRWYRTGDLAYRDEAKVFHHLGRIDNQVKVRGLRVELEEIEGYLRDIYQTDAVAAVAWPLEHGSANGIVAFVSGESADGDAELRAEMKQKLPTYMVPSAIHRVDSLPLNANGKVNRKELTTLLTEGRF